MLTFEMIRMDEVNRINEEEDNFPFETSSSSAGIKNKRNKKLILLDQKINSSYEKDIFYNADYDLSKPLMISRSGEIKKSLKKNKTFANKKWFKSTNINIKLFPFHGKKRFDYLNDLEDKDIENDSKYTDYVSKFMKNSFNTNNSLDKIENSKGISLTSKLDNETDADDNNKIKNISLYNSTIISMTDRLDIKKKINS
jgi:hypothetical protein